jgi:hypothetical protein
MPAIIDTVSTGQTKTLAAIIHPGKKVRKLKKRSTKIKILAIKTNQA